MTDPARTGDRRYSGLLGLKDQLVIFVVKIVLAKYVYCSLKNPG